MSYLFLFIGASRLMFSVVTMGISISSRAGFAFAHLLGYVMAVLFRYTVTFFFGLCFTSLKKEKLASFLSKLLV